MVLKSVIEKKIFSVNQSIEIKSQKKLLQEAEAEKIAIKHKLVEAEEKADRVNKD